MLCKSILASFQFPCCKFLVHRQVGSQLLNFFVDHRRYHNSYAARPGSSDSAGQQCWVPAARPATTIIPTTTYDTRLDEFAIFIYFLTFLEPTCAIARLICTALRLSVSKEHY